MSLKSWFEKTFPEEQLKRAERRSLPGLAAYHLSGTTPKQEEIRDISATGLYLLTDERWAPGSMNLIGLTCSGHSHKSSDHPVLVQTKAVRWGNDGIGLSFVLPTCMELWLWPNDERIEPVQILNEFRVARALAFLRRICPSATQELKLLFREGLSNLRIACAVEIALRAEEMLEHLPDSDKMQASDQLVLRVVKDGSWAEDDLTQRFWSGLLATSCSVGEIDESNLVFVDMLSQFATIHSRVFDTACQRLAKVMPETESITRPPMTFTADELIEIAGAHDLVKIDRNLIQLADLGLVDPRVKSRFFSYQEDANVTPTSLGLELHARCNGHRGTPQGPFGLIAPAARAQVRNL